MKRVSRHLVYLAARGVVQSQTIKGGVVYRVPADSAELQQIVLRTAQHCRPLIAEVDREEARATRDGRGSRR